MHGDHAAFAGHQQQALPRRRPFIDGAKQTTPPHQVVRRIVGQLGLDVLLARLGALPPEAVALLAQTRLRALAAQAAALLEMDSPSAEAFIEAFDPIDHDGPVTIDLSRARLWDITALAAVDKVRDRFPRRRFGTPDKLASTLLYLLDAS